MPRVSYEEKYCTRRTMSVSDMDLVREFIKKNKLVPDKKKPGRWVFSKEEHKEEFLMAIVRKYIEESKFVGVMDIDITLT